MLGHINSQTLVHCTYRDRRRLSFERLPERERRFSDVPSRMNDRRDTADIRISQDCGREPTARFFLMCTFGAMRWREVMRWIERSIVIKEFTYVPPDHESPDLPHLIRIPFPAPSFCNRDRYIPEIFLHFKRYIWISKVLPIFRNYNSLLPRTRKRGK